MVTNCNQLNENLKNDDVKFYREILNKKRGSLVQRLPHSVLGSQVLGFPRGEAVSRKVD